eukprot:7253638-Prymnesium_polylepis.1
MRAVVRSRGSRRLVAHPRSPRPGVLVRLVETARSSRRERRDSRKDCDGHRERRRSFASAEHHQSPAAAQSRG